MRSGRVVLWAMAALLVAYLSLPLAFFVLALNPSGLSGLAAPRVIDSAAVSLAGASVSTAVSVVLGVPLAYLLARKEFRFKPLVEGVVVMPLVVPPVVAGIFLLMAFGHGSFLGSMAEGRGFRLTRSLAGVVLAQTFVASPFLVLSAKAGFEEVDLRLEQASRLLGKSEVETFFRVSLPLARGPVLIGAVLTFARAMGEFGATLMVAYYPRTMPVQIWAEFVGGGLGGALPVAFLLVVLSMGVLLGVRLLSGGLSGWFDAGA